jgi:hypothetical protein
LSDEDLHEARSKRGLITRNNALSKGEMEANISSLLDLKLVGEPMKTNNFNCCLFLIIRSVIKLLKLRFISFSWLLL